MSDNQQVERGPSVLDKFLTLWIFISMGVGIGIGYGWTALTKFIWSLQVGTTSMRVAVGLILMIYRPLAKVRCEEMGKVFRHWKILAIFLVQNWIMGLLLVFGLATLFVRGYPRYATGLILIGVPRCIAMVIVWNDLVL